MKKAQKIVALLLVCMMLPLYMGGYASAEGTNTWEGQTLTIQLTDMVAGGKNFKSAADIFEQEYGVTVEIEQIDENMEFSDAINTINTRVMGGNPPDILQASGIDVDAYINKGIVRDFNELLDKDENKDEIKGQMVTNIFDLLSDDGKLYTVPLYYETYALLADTRMLEKYNFDMSAFDDFDAFMDECVRVSGVMAAEGGNCYLLPNRREFLSAMLDSEMRGFVDGKNDKVSFDSEQFKTILNAYMMTEIPNLFDPSDKTFWEGDTVLIPEQLVSIYNNERLFVWMPVNSYGAYKIHLGMFENNECFFPMPKIGEGSSGGLVEAETMMIMNGTGNEELAYEFLKFCISDSAQSTLLNNITYHHNINTHTVSAEARSAKIDKNIHPLSIDGVSFDLVPLTDDRIAMIDGINASANRVKYGNITFTDALYAKINNIFYAEGITDVEEIARRVQETMQTYMSVGSGDAERGYVVLYIGLGVAVLIVICVVIIRVVRKKGVKNG